MGLAMTNDDPYSVPLEGRVWVTVLHNETSRFMPFRESDTLRTTVGLPVVGPVGQPATHGELLAYVWAECNIDEPESFFGNIYRQARNRSLSVGDVVQVGDSHAWACEPLGWRQVALTPHQVADQPTLVVQDPATEMAYVVNANDASGKPTFPEDREDVG